MTKTIKNTTASPVFVADTGMMIGASATYTIPPKDYDLWSQSVNVDTYINNGTFIINDELDDLKTQAALWHIHNESVEREAAFLSAAVIHTTVNGTETIVASSRLLWVCTGTVAGQIFQLPDARTLNIGYRYDFWNRSTQQFVIQDAGVVSLFVCAVQQKTWAVLQDNTTLNGVWMFEANFLGGTGGGNGCLNFGYQGTANANRWLEVISNNPTNPSTGTPFVVAGTKAVRALSTSTEKGISATFTVSLYNNGVFLDSITVTAGHKNTKLNLNHVLLDKDELSAQITSGTATRPTFTVWL